MGKNNITILVVLCHSRVVPVRKILIKKDTHGFEFFRLEATIVQCMIFYC